MGRRWGSGRQGSDWGRACGGEAAGLGYREFGANELRSGQPREAGAERDIAGGDGGEVVPEIGQVDKVYSTV